MPVTVGTLLLCHCPIVSIYPLFTLNCQWNLRHIPTSTIQNVNHCKSSGRQLITRCNANAHHILCESTDINPRKSLVEYLVTSNLDVLNRENKPISLISHRQVIDLTLWTYHIGNLVRDWHICDKPSLSNHRYVLFQVWNEHVDKITFHDTKRTDWESYNDDLTKYWGHTALYTRHRMYSWPLTACNSPHSLISFWTELSHSQHRNKDYTAIFHRTQQWPTQQLTPWK